MNILRDESGQVVIPRPRFEAPVRAVASPQPQLVPPRTKPPKPQMAPTPHCLFFCRWCDAEILLSHAGLGLAFGPPAIRRIEVRSTAAVCAACSHVSGYSLFRGSYGFDTRNRLTQAVPRGKTILVDWMRCDEATCSNRLPLFFPTEEAITGGRIKELARTWQWQDLECGAGHRIKLPKWVFAPGPHQLPALLT